MDQGAKVRRTRKPEQKSLGSVLPLRHDLKGGTAGENQGAFYRVEETDWLIDWLTQVKYKAGNHLACTDWHAVASEPANMDTHFRASNL